MAPKMILDKDFRKFFLGGTIMINGPMMRSLSLKDYLGSRDLTEHLKLTNELTFHWANWDQTCLAQRKHYKNFNNNFHLMRLNQTLQELKAKPVWLCNKIKVMKSDLYSLYESYLDSRLRLTWFERKDEILFSFDSEQGPYYTLTSMKWLDNELYSQFVMRKILLEHYTLRSFRLNANIPVVFKLDNDVNEYGDKVQIHQLSEVGFIFKIKDKNFLNKIKNSTILELKIPVNQYKKVGSMKVEDAFKKLDEHQNILAADYMLFKLEARILNFYGNMNNAKRSSDEEFCIFARYEDLVPFGHETELKSIFAPLVEKTKIYFANSLEEFETNKAWKKSA
ncbi:MAG: hypothetical protein H7281_11910 [Bacteriovorax sp.]|nr:hypothetical protein [Bacteriovorax sp.]